MSDETRGWKRDQYSDYFKKIGNTLYLVRKRTTGFFPGEWLISAIMQNGTCVAVTEKHAGHMKLSDAKRAAHAHAEDPK